MAYKKIEYGFSFADIAIQAYADKNRNLLFLREIERSIDWQPVQDLLIEHYEPGKSKAGEKAYPPLLLFKNGLESNPILSWKARSMTGSLLSPFFKCL